MSYDWIAEASDVDAETTTISVSGARSLSRRITSKPDSAPTPRSTNAASNAPPASAASVSASDFARITR